MNLRPVLAKILAPVVLSTVAVGAAAVGAAPAEAVSFAAGVPAPVPVGGAALLSGWADLGRDCTGSFACANYLTIERATGAGWQAVAGSWAVLNGWNDLIAPASPGCSGYRTTVASFNDVAGPFPGVDLGPVGWAADGMPIERYVTTVSSPVSVLCW